MDASLGHEAVSSPAICLCILCGLPAVGKTSLARAVSSLALKRGWRSLTLTYDHLIPEKAFDLHASESGDKVPKLSTWKVHRQAVLASLERFLQNPVAMTPSEGEGDAVWCSFLRAVREQQESATPPATSSLPHLLILLDDNFYYQSMRHEVYQLARKHSFGFCQLYLWCRMELCLDRNRKRDHCVPDEVVMEMSKRMEPPNPEKNPWEQNSLTLHTDNLTDTDIQTLMGLICVAMERPLSAAQDDSEQRDADRQACARSVVHQADTACRRLVSQAMQRARGQQLSSERMRKVAQELNEMKSRFLQELRRSVLLELPLHVSGELLDVERVVERAATCFQSQTDDITGQHGVHADDTN